MTQKELIHQKIERQRNFIDSLSEETCKENTDSFTCLEEAAQAYVCYLVLSGKTISSTISQLREVTGDAFIAGAEWMRKKDVEDMYMSDNRHFLKCYEQGKVDMRVEMMKDAVEGEVYKFGDIAYVKESNNADLTKYLSKFDNGDKVKIIVIKQKEQHDMY